MGVHRLQALLIPPWSQPRPKTMKTRQGKQKCAGSIPDHGFAAAQQHGLVLPPVVGSPRGAKSSRRAQQRHHRSRARRG